MKNRIFTISLLSLATALCVVVTGCKSKPTYKQGAAAGTNLEKAADKITKTDDQVGAVMAGLTNLTANPTGDLSKQYKTWTSSLSSLQSMATDVQKVSLQMIEKGNEYFKAWDENLAAIANEDIRARSQQRKDEVSKSFAEIKRQYAQAEIDFRPFMSDLQDIKKFLDTDLTVGGLAAIKDTVTKAAEHAVPLRKSLGALSDEFRKLGVELMPTAPAPESATTTPAPSGS